MQEPARRSPHDVTVAGLQALAWSSSDSPPPPENMDVSVETKRTVSIKLLLLFPKCEEAGGRWVCLHVRGVRTLLHVCVEARGQPRCHLPSF